MFLDTPCSAVMDHVADAAAGNTLLLFGRSVRYGMPDQFFVTRKLAEAKSGEASRQCHAAPFFLHHGGLAAGLQPNFLPGFVEQYRQRWQNLLSPSEILSYIYGMLNCNNYREQFAAQICANYARIPLVPTELAREVAVLGQRLVDVHTGACDLELITDFPIGAAQTYLAEMVPSARWSENNGMYRIAINEEQYVDGVPAACKSFRISGYPVIDKWLQGRSGRMIDVNEIVELQMVVAKIRETISVMSKIDEVTADYFRGIQ